MPLPRSLINLILAFDFRDMFLRRRGVDSKDRYEISELLKLVVHQDRAHLKSSMSVEVYHPDDTDR